MKTKTGTLMALSLVCMGLFTGCASKADTLPQPAPTAGTVTSAPVVTTAPEATQSTQPAATATAQPAVGAASTVADARRLSDRVEDEVDKLSEVDEADAVVVGNIALVGISYDGQYQGGMTDRLKDMIIQRVETTDKSITAVHVTDNDALRKAIGALNDTMDDATASFEELQTKALEIAAQLTGGSITQPEGAVGSQQQSTT